MTPEPRAHRAPYWTVLALAVAALIASVAAVAVVWSASEAPQTAEDHRRLRELSAEMAVLQNDFLAGDDTVALATQMKLSESVELADRLGDELLTAERISLAFALMMFAENAVLADTILEDAFASARTVPDRVLVLLTRAGAAFALNDAETGRVYVTQALELPAVEEFGSQLLVDSANAKTRLNAAGLELTWNNCHEAVEHATVYRVLFDRLDAALAIGQSMIHPDQIDNEIASCQFLTDR